LCDEYVNTNSGKFIPRPSKGTVTNAAQTAAARCMSKAADEVKTFYDPEQYEEERIFFLLWSCDSKVNSTQQSFIQ